MDALFASRKRSRDGDEYSSVSKRVRSGSGGLEGDDTASDNTGCMPSARPQLTRFHTYPLRATLQPLQLMDSPDGDAPPSLGPSSVGSPASFASLPTPSEANDVVMMADDVSIVESTSPPSPRPAHFVKPPRLPQLYTPPPLSATEQFTGGRVPTPIFSSFPAGAQQQQPTRLSPVPKLHPSSLISSSARLDPAIPSPICEGEMDAEMEAEYAYTGSRLSQLSFREDSMEVDDGKPTISPPSSPPTSIIPPNLAPLQSPPTPRTGRARSGAITERRRFFMGYRDDCEKCRLKVPNHFAHFVPAS